MIEVAAIFTALVMLALQAVLLLVQAVIWLIGRLALLVALALAVMLATARTLLGKPVNRSASALPSRPVRTSPAGVG